MSPSPLVRAAASPAPRSDAIHSPSDAKRCSKLSRARRCWLRATAACRLPPERVWLHNALSSQHLPLAEGAHQNATPEDANERPRLTSLIPTPVHRLRNPCVASTSGPLRRAPPRVRRARIPSQVHGQRCAAVAEGPAALTPFARRCVSVPPRLRPAGVLGFNASGLADVEGFQRAKALKKSQKSREEKNNFYIRGNRIWGARAKCSKITRCIEGNTWEMTFTPQIGPDLASVSDFLKIEKI